MTQTASIYTTLTTKKVSVISIAITTYNIFGSESRTLISFFTTIDSNNCPDDVETDDMFAGGECSQTELIQRCNFSSQHLIDARLASTKSLLCDDSAATPSSFPATTNETNTGDSINIRERSYPAMLKLISGSIVGESKYAEIYAQLDLDEQEQPTAQQSSSSDSETSEPTIPTLRNIARKVARIEGKELDEKQHTTYEIICCTFLMGLIKDGRDAGTKLGQYLSHTLTGSSTTNTTNLIEQLEARGGVDQLLMFLTGAAGAGKSTAVKVRT